MPYYINILLNYALVALAGLLVTFLSVPLVIRLSNRYGILDLPGDRRIHAALMPRAGGLALAFGTHFACLLAICAGLFPGPSEINLLWWGKFFLGSLIILAVGIIDDIVELRPLQKLSGQIVVAILMFLLNIKFGLLFGFELPGLLDLLLSVSWFLFLINAINFIDGIDGLATGIASIAALGILGTLLYRDLLGPALALTGFIGACVGFLYFNRFPAKIFLGDCGSNFIGFFLALLTLQTGSKGSAFTYLWVPVLALSVPIIDLTLAVWRRAVRKGLNFMHKTHCNSGIMIGDLEHLHHRLMRLKLSQREVVSLLCLINSFFVLIGLIGLPFQERAWGFVIIAIIVTLYVLVIFIPVQEFRDSITFVLAIVSNRRSPWLALLFFLVIDIISLQFALFFSIRLSHVDFSFETCLSIMRERSCGWTISSLCIIAVLGFYKPIVPLSFSKCKNYLAVALIPLVFFISGCVDLFTKQKPATITIHLLLFATLGFVCILTTRIILFSLEKIAARQLG